MIQQSHKHTLVSAAVAAALGLSSMSALADPVTGLVIEDVGSNTANGIGKFSAALDGRSGAFIFDTKYLNTFSYLGTSPFTGDVGTGTMLGGGVANPTGSYSTGFLFSGAPFTPYTFGGDFVADIDVNHNLDITSLDFGGNFGPGQDFDLPPDVDFPIQVLWVEQVAANSDEFKVAFRWGHDITSADDPSGKFTAFTAQWVLEGTITVTDSAPQVTVTGANPVGVFPNAAYTDAGATCLDTVSGNLTSAITVILDDNPAANCNIADVGPDGGTHTCEYVCEDSATNVTTATRTINVSGTDTAPPVVTRLSQTNINGDGRNDAADGSSVDILVGQTYTDAGATCVDDFDNTIALSGTGVPANPGFTVTPDPAAINTSAAGTTTLTFSCDDTVGNGPTNATRAVNVIADNQAPVLKLLDSPNNSVPIGTTVTLSNAATSCTDTNPIDEGQFDIVSSVLFTPPSINTNVAGTTTVTYTCEDSAGNAATPVTQTYTVFDPNQATNFAIVSMTISDVLDQNNNLGTDGFAGCFLFDPSQIPVSCFDGAKVNQFSSDGSASDSSTIPGVGTDGGILFGQFQGFGAISPGFMYSGFPFKPFTFDPPSATATPPAGYISVAPNGVPLALTLTSFPFGGAYQSPQPNDFFLDPDRFPPAAEIIEDNDGNPNTFAYRVAWSHVITEAEDPTLQFSSFTSQWRLEGTVTVDPTPIIVNNAPDISSVTATQGAGDTQIVIAGDGPVTATVTASDVDGDSLSYDWSGSSSSLIPTMGNTNSTFNFSPAGLSEGVYPLSVAVSDGTVSVDGGLLLRVLAENPAQGTGDSDGDGTADNLEGVADSDGDGLPNYHDAIEGDPTRNRADYSDPSQGDVVSDTGVLKLGTTAFVAGDDNFAVTEMDIRDGGGPNGASTSNFRDRFNDVVGREHSGGGIFDWRVDGLTAGDTVCVVLPQAVALPNLPAYRKYTPTVGWHNFIVGGNDQLASAKRAGGACPDPGAAAYSNAQGLVEGDTCVRVCVMDGGANDADGTIDGSVSDPGTVHRDGAVPVSIKDSGGGCTLSVLSSDKAAQHAEWWLLGGFIAWLGVMRKRLIG